MTNFEAGQYAIDIDGVEYRIDEVGDGWVAARILDTDTILTYGDHPHATGPMNHLRP